jgi:RNA polymerase primary sigma factor
VKSLQLNNNRIEALVEQLYASTATWCRWKAACCVWLKAMVSIAEFLKTHQGSELDANWVRRSPIWPDPAGSPSSPKKRKREGNSRSDIRELATETGLDVSEFRRIVNKVQKGEREAARSPRRRWSKPICAW